MIDEYLDISYTWVAIIYANLFKIVFLTYNEARRAVERMAAGFQH